MRHFELTGSPRAVALLDGWGTARRQFVRVAPRGVKVQQTKTWITLRERVLHLS